MMDNYIIQKYGQGDLAQLRKDWQLLEKGKDMSYFQTYNWYESINDIIPSKGEVVFLEVIKSGKVLLIAPLWILRHTYLLVNKQGCYFWGKDGYSDYLNFIYSEFDGEALNALFAFIRKEYGVSRYYLEFLQEGGEAVSYIEQLVPNIHKISFFYPVLNLPNEVELYSKGLSKHARQNLRTAHNRTIKDGLTFNSTIIEKCSDRLIRYKCEEIRKERLPYKTKTMREQWSLKTKIHMFFDDRLRIKFPYHSVIDVEKNGNLLLITCGDDIAAFFYFGYELPKKRVVVMTAGTNAKYARYSPGFYYMYQQIRRWIEDGSVKTIDFTRGGEKYKYDLGCVGTPVCNLFFTFK